MTTNSFNNDSLGNAHGDSGESGVIWAGDNYASPWDLWYRDVLRKQPAYVIHNGDSEQGSPYDLLVTAYVGLAYFDGVNDGVFNDHKTGAVYPLSTSLGGNYPNLYGGSVGQEAGRLVRVTNTFTVLAYPNPNSSIRIESVDLHLAKPFPVNNPAHPGLPGEDEGFTYLNLTGPERALLYDYGKVFFYEVEVIDKYTGATVFTTFMHPEIKTLPTGPMPNPDWKPIEDMAGNHLQGTAPGGLGNLDLYYYNAGLPNGTVWNVYSNPSSGKCDSREVAFDVPVNLHEIAIPGGNYKLTLNFLQNNFWLWQNSALYLSITQ